MTDYKHHRFHVLDGMRGIAAVIVMLMHYYIHSDIRYFCNAYLAVDFFFILSGFVIFHAYGGKLSAGMSAAAYLAKRIARLYPLAAIGILIGTPILYLQLGSYSTSYSQRDFAATLATNLLMLPYFSAKTFVTPEMSIPVQLFPADSPLWSIFFELVGSIGFLWLIRMNPKQLKRFCLISFLFLCGLAFLHGFTRHERLIDTNGGFETENFLLGFPRVFYGFSIGMLIYKWRTSRMVSTVQLNYQPVRALTLYLALAAMLLFPSFLRSTYGIIVLGLIAPGIVWLGSGTDIRDSVTVRLSVWLGQLSFPIYCLHRPVLAAILELHRRWWSLDGFHMPDEWLAVVLTIGLSTVVLWLLSALKVQQRLSEVLSTLFLKLSAQ